MDQIGLFFKFILFYTFIAWVGGKEPLNVSYLEPGSRINHSPSQRLGFRHTTIEVNKTGFWAFCQIKRSKFCFLLDLLLRRQTKVPGERV